MLLWEEVYYVLGVRFLPLNDGSKNFFREINSFKTKNSLERRFIYLFCLMKKQF